MEFVAAPCNGLKSFLSDRNSEYWLNECPLSLQMWTPESNDLPEVVTSNVKVFADDCLIYKTNQSTTQSNKENLSAFGKWKKWLAGGITPAEMYHHPYLKKRYPVKASYQLHSHTLEETCHGASASFQIRLRQLEQLVFWESTEIAQMKYMIWHIQTTTQE